MDRSKLLPGPGEPAHIPAGLVHATLTAGAVPLVGLAMDIGVVASPIFAPDINAEAVATMGSFARFWKKPA